MCIAAKEKQLTNRDVNEDFSRKLQLTMVKQRKYVL